MKLYEYQAKNELKEYDINTPKNILIGKDDNLTDKLSDTPFPVMLKCQLLSGGRGKRGLIKKVDSLDDAVSLSQAYFENVEGLQYILVEECIDYDKEIYISFSVDSYSGNALLMGSMQGGVDIEETAAKDKDTIVKTHIDLNLGIQNYQVNDFLYTMGIGKNADIKQLIYKMYKLFCSLDAELVEINPLFLLKDGQIISGDAKISIDDNSMFRHIKYEKDRSHYKSDMEYEAAKEGIPYIEFGGDISLMCAGAGLANTVYDLVNFEGGNVANYLEFGGPNYMKAGTAMRLCLQNKPKVVLIVTFGTIARADIMAEGIREAILEYKPSCKIIACLRGTGEERVNEIFSDIGLTNLSDTEEAVRQAVRYAKEG